MSEELPWLTKGTQTRLKLHQEEYENNGRNHNAYFQGSVSGLWDTGVDNFYTINAFLFFINISNNWEGIKTGISEELPIVYFRMKSKPKNFLQLSNLLKLRRLYISSLKPKIWYITKRGFFHFSLNFVPPICVFFNFWFWDLYQIIQIEFLLGFCFVSKVSVIQGCLPSNLVSVSVSLCLWFYYFNSVNRTVSQIHILEHTWYDHILNSICRCRHKGWGGEGFIFCFKCF